MMNQPAPWGAAVDGHVERVDDELVAEVVGHRPADDAAAVAIDDRREIQPALPGADVGDVGGP